MFGYITVNKQELKLKDYDVYHSFYCGVCHSLYTRYGRRGQLTLSFDMTFTALLLSGLYEPDSGTDDRFCVLHPAQKQTYISNAFIDYAADMNVLLAFFNLHDDWTDDHNIKSRTLEKLLSKNIPELKERYPRQYRAVQKYVTRLAAMEDRKEKDIDKVAGLTGEMLAQILAVNDDMWAADLKRLGFFLGKFIYLMDAYEDRASDKKDGNYNIWLLQNDKYGDEEILSILNLMMSEGALAFEALPIIKYADILRNIIYSGVWIKYEMLKAKEKKE